MHYGPDVALAQVMSDRAALAIVGRHLPDVLAEPELRLAPFTTLGDLPRFVRGAGEQEPDVNEMWRELAALGTRPATLVPQTAPAPVSANYEPSTVERG
jgi:hypothetical protein